jgi:acetylglutamate/LysW-gamma-L-alpha-aminoadipate kinase
MEKLLVVKLGGGEGLDMPRACRELAEIARQRPLVIIHGVSARMNQMCGDLGVAVRTITSPNGHSSRYTDARTRDIYVAAARSVNAEIVEWLTGYGVQAQGVADNVVIQGERKEAIRAVVDGRVRIIRDDYTGTISGVNSAEILSLLERGIVPVLPPMALSADGLLNVDGDRAGAAVAASLSADTLIILSNVRGLLRDVQDSNSLISEVPFHQMTTAMNYAEGRMKRKVLGAEEALNGGVQRVIIGDGRIPNPVSTALNGAGTTFLNREAIREMA